MSDTLTMNGYQTAAGAFARYPQEAKLTYPILGLVGEVGELAAKLLELAPETDDDHGLGATVRGILDEMAAIGRIAEQAKKGVRDGNSMTDEDKAWSVAFWQAAASATPVAGSPTGKELGDAQWYVAKTAGDLGLMLGAVGQVNVDKLTDRAARQVISGSGDNR